jgi:hypothetical protein
MLEIIAIYLLTGWLVTTVVEFWASRHAEVELLYRRSVLLWPLLLVCVIIMALCTLIEMGLE